MIQLIRAMSVLILAVACAGCKNSMAESFVKAPNRNSPLRGLDAPQTELAEHHVADQIRVNVGPPDASLEVWVVDPVTGPAYLSLTPGTSDQADQVARLTMVPATRPDDHAERPIKGTIFLLHGLSDSMADGQYKFYSLGIACQGYRVVLVDLRGHGRSTGEHISYGAYESRDMVQVLNALERRGLVAGKVGVLGVSYGASVGICWAAIDPRVRAVVAVEPFSSLTFAAYDAGARLLGAMRWVYSKHDIQDMTDRVCQIDGIDPERDSPLYAISHMNTPVLLIHGKRDNFVTPAHSIRLHEAAPNHSELILVNGADHFDLMHKAVNLIMTESNDWFERDLAK